MDSVTEHLEHLRVTVNSHLSEKAEPWQVAVGGAAVACVAIFMYNQINDKVRKIYEVKCRQISILCFKVLPIICIWLIQYAASTTVCRAIKH